MSATPRKKTVMGIYWEHTRRHPWIMSGIVSTVIGAELFALSVPFFYRNIINALFAWQPSASFNVLVTTLILIVVCRGMGWMLTRLSGVFIALLEPRMLVFLEHLSLANLLDHAQAFFADAFTGSLVKKIHRFSRAYADILENCAWRFLSLAISTSAIVSVLFTRDARLGLAALVWIALFSALNVYIVKSKLALNHAASKKDSEISGALADILSNHLNVSLFNGRGRELAWVGSLQATWRKLKFESWMYSIAGYAAQNILNVATEFVVMYVALRLWQRGRLTIGDFVLLQSYLLILFGKLEEVGRTIRLTYDSLVEAQEMVDIFNTPHEIKDAPAAKPLHVTRGLIEFRGLSFSYHKRKVLEGFDLRVAPGEKIALVGPSGAGKSTIVKLLFRFYDLPLARHASAGIFIDGQSIRTVTRASLREALSLVPQEPTLFHRSLKDNILYGSPGASEQQVIEAAKKAHCHEFISRLPAGYDTYVGERGIKLSGGERQRVAMARAILKDSPILVLDEATSSLDSESEALIQAALEELMRHKTTIVIAHRLSTIRRMDRIVVIENGRVADAGSHADLLEKDGKYRTLWNIQAGSFSAGA